MDTEHRQASDVVAVRAERHDDHVDVALVGPLHDTTPAQVAHGAELVVAAGQEARRPVRLVADHPADALLPLPELVAERAGLTDMRDLLQLRVALPIPADHPTRAGAPAVAVRPFALGHDEPAWVTTNNRAFAWHPDQAGRTVEQLTLQLAEPWVDLDGFLVLDDPTDPQRLAGSCWTRVHPAAGDEPALGEIFVIGVDPDHHGHGLGAALVLAGLDHLAGSGVGTGMLYVEADNGPALRLYERLGFEVHLRRRIRS